MEEVEGVPQSLRAMVQAFRPFPKEALREVCRKLNLVIVLDRTTSSGSGGIVSAELAATLYNSPSRPYIMDYILGMAGRPVTVPQLFSQVKSTISDYQKQQIKQSIQWIGVRGL